VSVHPEDRLDRPFLRTAAQRVRAGSAPREQRERREHDRFPGTRLTRQHVQAGAELELHRLDEGQVLDSQELDHRSHPSGPGRTGRGG
jgi:hypothetical protein